MSKKEKVIVNDNFSTDVFRCGICGGLFSGMGNSPFPIIKEEGAKCCDMCGDYIVLPARCGCDVSKIVSIVRGIRIMKRQIADGRYNVVMEGAKE